MSSLTLSSFTSYYINNSLDVPSTKVDKTLKAIINNFKRDSLDSSSTIIVDYLNKLRTLYFLERLKYYNPSKERDLKSKYNPKFF